MTEHVQAYLIPGVPTSSLTVDLSVCVSFCPTDKRADPHLANFDPNPPYDGLPDCCRHRYAACCLESGPPDGRAARDYQLPCLECELREKYALHHLGGFAIP